MRKTLITSLLAVFALAAVAGAEPDPANSPPTSPDSPSQPGPATQPSTGEAIKPTPGVAAPLQAVVDTPLNIPLAIDRNGKVVMTATTQPATMQREGTFVFDRVGRLTRSADGSRAEFIFENDGKTREQRVILLPNLKLMTMEDVAKITQRRLRFRITGMVTEFRTRNYLLLEKVAVPPEAAAGQADAAAQSESTPAEPAEAKSQLSPDQTLKDLLKPTPGVIRPLKPPADPSAIGPAIDRNRKVVAPNTPTIALRREGTFIFDRVGRLTHSADGLQAEFTFEADGKTMKDPPVIILPNLRLMNMEDIVKMTNRDLRFRVSGMLTEYRGRNYLLLEKVVVPPEGNAQF